MLCQTMEESAAFVFGKQGCLTDTELHTALKVRERVKTALVIVCFYLQQSGQTLEAAPFEIQVFAD